MIKKLFGKKNEEQEYTIDDLIVLERYEEAEYRLKERIEFRKDIHDHLKLADVYLGLKQVTKAVDEYVFVADEYADDGFYERALAILTKARRLNPMDDTLEKKVLRFEHLRSLERKRKGALEGFLEGQVGDEASGTAVMEFDAIWNALGKTRFGRDLDGDQLRLLFQAVQVLNRDRGFELITQGGTQEVLYIVASGEVQSQIPKAGEGAIDIRMFGAGQVIGEEALFQHKPWPADYIVRSKRALLLSLDQKGVEKCLTGNPDPRGFLDLLRREQNDREVAQSVARLQAGR